jgi:hypothetical protein
VDPGHPHVEHDARSPAVGAAIDLHGVVEIAARLAIG